MLSLHVTVPAVLLEGFSHDNERDYHFSAALTSWVLTVLGWAAVYGVYKKVVTVFLRRLTLPFVYRIRFSEALWNAGFCIICIPLCATKLLVQVDRVTDLLNIVSANVFITQEAVTIDALPAVVICAYYVHSIYLTYDRKGFDVEFFARGLLLLFLYTCYSLRYIWAGLSAITLINICALNVEFMRICYSLNQNKMIKSDFMQNVTVLLFAVYCILWGVVFLCILPQCYLLPAVNIWTSEQNILAFTVLCTTLWSYFGLQICCAPAVKLICYCVLPYYSSSHRDWLNCSLFQQCSEELLQLKTHSVQHDYCKKEELQNGVRRTRNSLALYQTVRCVIAIKRRIRRKRAAKALASSSSELEATSNRSVHGNM